MALNVTKQVRSLMLCCCVCCRRLTRRRSSPVMASSMQDFSTVQSTVCSPSVSSFAAVESPSSPTIDMKGCACYYPDVSLVMNPPVSTKGLAGLMSCTKFSRCELQRMYRRFKNDFPKGSITVKEFTAIFAQLFPSGDSNAYARYIFNTYDDNEDGRISFDEFIMGLSMTLHGTKERQLKWAFQLYDLNGDGYISEEELVQVIEAIHRTLGHSPSSLPEGFSSITKCARHIIKKMDMDEDGFIGQHEFMYACLQDENISHNLGLFAVSSTSKPTGQEFQRPVSDGLVLTQSSTERRRKLGMIVLPDQRQAATPKGLQTHWNTAPQGSKKPVLAEVADGHWDDDSAGAATHSAPCINSPLIERNRHTTV